MNDYTNFIKTLNPEQKMAVMHGEGPCCVIAVPGSGKTRCLTARFARLLNDGVLAENILCCTFTNKAANEMKERIVALTGISDLPYVGTMHSIFCKILSDSPEYHRYKYDDTKLPVLNRDYRKEKYLKLCAKEFGDDYGMVNHGHVLSSISYAKNSLMDPNQYKQYLIEKYGTLRHPAGNGCRDICDYYRLYEHLKDKDCYIDYDDMLYKTYQMLDRYPSILKVWRNRFKYILVDEFQDINKAQWEVIKLLAGKSRNVFVVGDANQSIYGFRGSRPEFMYEFASEMPGANVIGMSTNYRSGEGIINVANMVADKAEYTVNKIVGIRNGGHVYGKEFMDISSEAAWVVRKIRSLISSGTDPEEIGVVYRTRSVSGSYEFELIKNDIQFCTRDGDGFFGSSAVRDIVAYLDASIHKNCASSLSRILNRPNRYLGSAFKTAWEENLNKGIEPVAALLEEYSMRYWTENALDLYSHLQEIRRISVKRPLNAVLQYIYDEIGYRAWLQGEEDVADISKSDMLDEILSIAANLSIDEFIKMSNRAMNDRFRDTGVMLSTVHGVKGLEFEIVFLTDVNDGILPHCKAGSDGLQEERRIMYVAITRAKDMLYVTSVNPSTFVGELRLTSSPDDEEDKTDGDDDE